MHGNYKGYYKRRQENDRYQFLKEEWFTGKACLDIGCNEGVVTAMVAEKFNPRFILGIDSDGLLIDAANSRLKRLKYSFNNRPSNDCGETTETIEQPPKKKPMLLFTPRCLLTSIPKAIPAQLKSSSIAKNTPDRPQSDTVGCNNVQSAGAVDSVQVTRQRQTSGITFPFNLAFQLRDILSMDIESGPRYDTVLCFSVAKWIQLNHADAGLLKFFQIMFDLLRPDGLLIFEYQPWKSYVKRKAVSETAEETFKTIQVFPAMFESILVERIGFTTVERLGPPEEEAKGFNRPILVMKKSARLPSLEKK